MLFSFKQFQETKQALIKQFEQQPVIDYQSEQYAHHSSNIINQYNKLLNQIKFSKHKDNAQNKVCINDRLQMKLKSSSRVIPKSATFRKRLPDGVLNFSKQNFMEQRNQLKQRNNQIYLTQYCPITQYKVNKNQYEIQEDIQTKAKREKRQLILGLLYNNSNTLETEKYEQQTNLQQNSEQIPENAQQILNLRVKIFETVNQQKYLQTQIQQLEQSVRYYKRLNNDLQVKIDQKQKKHTIVLNSMLKKQSDLNSIDSRNKYFKEKFQATQRFFAKSLKSIKISRNSQSKKCTQLVDDVTQKILTMKFYRQKVRHQKQQIVKLDQKHKYKMKRIQQNKNMHFYAEMLIKLGKIAIFLKNNQYGKMEKMESLRKQMEEKQQGSKNKKQRCTHKNQTSIFGLNSNNKSNDIQNRKNNKDNTKILISKKDQIINMQSSKSQVITSSFKKQKQEHKYDEINFLNLTKQILRSYLKLVKDQQGLKQTYQYKLNEMENNRKYLYHVINENEEFCQAENISPHPQKQNENQSINIIRSNFINKNQHKKNNQKESSYFKQSPSRNDEWIKKKKIIELSVFNKQFNEEIKKFQSMRQINKEVNSNYIKNKNMQKQKRKLSKGQYQSQSTLKRLGQKIKKLNETILSIEQRSKFFLKRQIKFLQKIIRKWLKFDQSAINFLFEVINKYIKIQSKSKQSLSTFDTKQILVQHFQNWEKYLFFIEQIHNNPFFMQSMNKNKLKQQFKRIIKTKLNYPNVPTQKIFVKCLKQLYRDRIGRKLENIKTLIKLGLQIYLYSNKFQVLIVNTWKIQDDQQSIQNSGLVQRANTEENYPQKKKTQNQQQSSEYTLTHNPYLKMLGSLIPQNTLNLTICAPQGQKQKHYKTCNSKIRNKSKEQQPSSSEISDGYEEQNQLIEINQNYNKQNKDQQALALVSFIIAYQTQINKIKNAKIIGKEKFS